MFFYFGFNRRHSDDPLISGAIDDNQNEFDTLQNCSNSLSSIEKSSSNYNNKTAATSPRVRKSGNIKLRFHNQAIPQQYLNHLDATQNQLHAKEMTLRPALSTNPTRSGRRIDRIGIVSNDNNSNTAAAEQPPIDAKTAKSQWLQRTKQPNGKDVVTARRENEQDDQKKHQVVMAAQNQSTKAHDLPYMGEITLDNFKPRRGRKPKKADICHLIYKNYGTVFPNQKIDEAEVGTGGDTAASNEIQSLLERRLTTSAKHNSSSATNRNSAHSIKDGSAEEPLNLCVRDRYDSDVMTVISDDDTIDAEKLIDFKPELALLSHTINNSNGKCPPSFKMAIPNFQSALIDGKNESSEMEIDAGAAVDLNSYGCWQNSAMFINPMVLYLQKIANANANANGGSPSNNHSSAESSKPVQATASSIESETNASRNLQKRILVPKKMSQLLKEDIMSAVASGEHSSHAISTAATVTTASNKSTVVASQANQKNSGQPPKRKRSAIFIPPLPEESSTNHATEVSICKFKFTGGAKPSLQEKKSLQVDACGNFRYYSGTGDKSIRGYEFFPRESLKKSSLTTASSAGAFLSTTGQKIGNREMQPLPASLGNLNNESLQIPDANISNSAHISSIRSSATPNQLTATQQQQQHQHQPQQHHNNQQKQHYMHSRKRKSKRSMQREKLEKTFKEKGFLIQTQQLEQAEGILLSVSFILSV